MSAHKLYLEGKRIQQRAAALSSTALSSKEKINVAEQLLSEIDDLALLLDQVKKQSDRIQALADAIGDSIIDATNLEATALARMRTKADSAATKAHPRLRPEPFAVGQSVVDGADR
jgi:transposase